MVDELDFLQEEKPKREEEQHAPRKFFTPGTIVLIIGMVAIAVVLGVQLFRQNQVQLQPGITAPDFSLTTYEGEDYTLSELRGQVVVMNIWAMWCPPCHQEAPDFQAIHEDYADQGVVLLGVNWLDIEADALGFIEQYSITYPNGPDIGGRIGEKYNFQGPPETWVIDQEGVIAATFIGSTTYDTLASVLDRLLAGENS